MGFLDAFFGRPKGSASMAKERLQIVVNQQRAGRDAPDFLPLMRREMLAVVGKYYEVSDEMIEIRLERTGEASRLEINVALDKARIRPRPQAQSPQAQSPQAQSPQERPPEMPALRDPKTASAGG